ncbi:putative cytokinin riboside 5'-monophosphate phosphoribohydrolase LOG6 [Gossypium australe]|uniref:cytokinin riboside 5'-monophosphate phosphoribohydrolase n=1 Tax=Gossypium australe TaxID=47621 RepID=A0A5B6UPA9_9ROSI|nr:putative cytokinin riboside 5'-monophosphate phosphoribohydrolase LOG6 [Gossypium australe]
MEMEGEVVKSRFKRVCVFCGSRTGKRKCYTDVAVELAQELVHPKLLPDISLNPVSFLYVFFLCRVVFGKVARSLDLVYGGGSIRLMGIVSKTVHRAGGNCMLHVETHITGETVGEVRPVGNMNQRKKQWPTILIVLLPYQVPSTLLNIISKFTRGYGTLEELLEVITWVQLGIHDKPIIIWLLSN